MVRPFVSSGLITNPALAQGAFAGNYNISNTTWNNWGSNGNWWYGSSGQYFNGNSNGNMNTNTNTNNWFSVRCVQK